LSGGSARFCENRVKQLELHLNPHLATSTFDVVINRFTTQMLAEGITQTKFLNTGQLAGAAGMREDYDTMNQVCSKFVHPTAWSILTEDIGQKGSLTPTNSSTPAGHNISRLSWQ
jgi:hypothetical protein